VASAQGNLGFLAKSPAGNFTKEDWALLKGALTSVLQSGADAQQSWNNPATGAGGKVRTLKDYRDPQGQACKQLQFDSRARGYQGSFKQDLCRQEDGSWLSTDGGVHINGASGK
jgi:surface antigen